MFIIDEVSKNAEIVDFAKWKSNCINNGLCEINFSLPNYLHSRPWISKP